MTTAKQLLDVYDAFDWEHYIELVDQISKIDKYAIEEELIKGPRVYAYYIGLLNLAKSSVNKIQTQLDNFYHNNRKTLVTSSDKKIADNKLDSLVMSNEQYIIIRDKLNEAISKESLFKGLIASLEQKHQNLIQLSSNQRAEMKLTS